MRVFLAILMAFGMLSAEPRYKLYCLYTPDFQDLYEHYFLPSIKDNFELVVKKYPQECPLGMYYAQGWDKTMLRKLEMLEEAIQEHFDGRIFFYSDIDLIFLRPVLGIALAHLGDYDFVVQQGWPRRGLCAGFFVMRGNKRTLKLIQAARQLMIEKKCLCDQTALQSVLDSYGPATIAWKFLPSEQFPNGRRVLKTSGPYTSQSEIKLPPEMVLFHATNCIGLDNKYHFLRRVERAYHKLYTGMEGECLLK